MLTQTRLKEVLHYDPLTGVFTNLTSRRKVVVGAVSGSKTPNGYITIGIDQQHYQAHRLSFLYMTGSFPEDMVDHINCIRDDNRWENLREATAAQNLQNIKICKLNKSGFKGVFQTAPGKPYTAKIKHEGVQYYLGSFATKEAAALAYKIKSEELHSHRYNDNRDLGITVSDLVDHKTDNRRSIREVNTTGYLGVHKQKDSGKFWARIQKEGVAIFLGTFNTAEEASAAYQAKSAELYSTS